jgi:hypothetical protein
MPLFVICEILGVPTDDRRRLYELTARMFGSDIKDRAAALRDGMAAAEEMRRYGSELGRRKSLAPSDDLVSELVTAEFDGRRLTNGEFEAFFMLLFNAGADTTRSSLHGSISCSTGRDDRRRGARLPYLGDEEMPFTSHPSSVSPHGDRDTELAGRWLAGDSGRPVCRQPRRDQNFAIDRSPPALAQRSPRVWLDALCLGAHLARLKRTCCARCSRPTTSSASPRAFIARTVRSIRHRTLSLTSIGTQHLRDSLSSMRLRRCHALRRHGMNSTSGRRSAGCASRSTRRRGAARPRGYQRPLTTMRSAIGQIQIVEWHCGFEPGVYHHVYPMVLFPAEYFSSARETGTYFHWISFVDPARGTPAIAEGLPTVHRAEARSLKAQLEKRAGHRHAVEPALALKSHTVYVDAPPALVMGYLADPSNATSGDLLRRDGARIFDEYDTTRARLTCHDLGGYQLIERRATSDRHRDPHADLVVPSRRTFAQPAAPGVVLHRITAWPWKVSAPAKASSRSTTSTTPRRLRLRRILEGKAETSVLPHCARAASVYKRSECARSARAQGWCSRRRSAGGCRRRARRGTRDHFPTCGTKNRIDWGVLPDPG